MRVLHLARKPLVGTVASNVEVYGTGGINIDGCRVGSGSDKKGGPKAGHCLPRPHMTWNAGRDGSFMHPTQTDPTKGRWPANLIFQHHPDCTENSCHPECSVKALDEQSGILHSHPGSVTQDHLCLGYHGNGTGYTCVLPGSFGGASRFFKQVKPS